MPSTPTNPTSTNITPMDPAPADPAPTGSALATFDAPAFWAKTSRKAWEGCSEKEAGREGGDCWFWQARTGPDGYGIHYEGGRHHRAHRVAYLLRYGDLPPVVMHTCDEPACCNPAHLRGGTQRQNLRDRDRKGRQARGQDNGRAKLGPGDVREIRRRYREENASQRQLARAFGLADHSTVGAIVRRETWAHV